MSCSIQTSPIHSQLRLQLQPTFVGHLYCPAALAAAIMPSMEAVVIGIGAGAATDGQVLVFHDLLGMSSGGSARFVKRYADVHGQVVEGLRRYSAEVRDRSYPGPEHCYGINADELAAFRATLPQPAG